MKRILFLVVLVLVATATVLAQGTTWTLDRAHSNITFTVQHMVISEVFGKFRDFDIKVVSPNEDLTGASITAVIKTASIFTDDERRDNHLKSDDFFNAEKFPEITFTSTKIEKVGDKKFKIHGLLTIRDITKPMVFDAVFNGAIPAQNGGTRSGWQATLSVNRFDYGLKWNRAIETGRLVVGETVNITVNAQFIRPAS